MVAFKRHIRNGAFTTLYPLKEFSRTPNPSALQREAAIRYYLEGKEQWFEELVPDVFGPMRAVRGAQSGKTAQFERNIPIGMVSEVDFLLLTKKPFRSACKPSTMRSRRACITSESSVRKPLKFGPPWAMTLRVGSHDLIGSRIDAAKNLLKR